MRLGKIKAPALPESSGVIATAFAVLIKVLRLYFTRIDDGYNQLVGNNGGRFLEAPNGLFFDLGDQALAVINTAQPVRFNQTYLNNGVSINGVTTSEITVEHGGVYNFQVSARAVSGSGSTKTLWMWINRNGTDVGYSTKEYTVAGSGKELELVWNFTIDVLAGQYIQMKWTANDINVSLDFTAATSPHPGIPSAVVAVHYVSALPNILPVLP